MEADDFSKNRKYVIIKRIAIKWIGDKQDENSCDTGYTFENLDIGYDSALFRIVTHDENHRS